MFQEIINTILIKLRLWLQDFYIFIWRRKIIRKLFKHYVYEPRNIELKNIHLGKRAFIIGNGPSILKQDLTKLNGEIIFVFNNFILHPKYSQINPTYLCNSDIGSRFSFTSSNEIEYRKKWYKLHEKIRTFKTIMLFNKASEKLHKKYGLFQKHKTYYLRPASMLLPPLSSLKYCPTDLTMPLAGHFLVFIDIALLAAYYMGINKIYLLGFDNQPIKTFNDYLNFDFYGKDLFISVKEYRQLYQFHHQNQALKKSRQGLYEKSVACIKRTFARKKIEIFNATYNRGNLQGFAYANFADVIKNK